MHVENDSDRIEAEIESLCGQWEDAGRVIGHEQLL